MSRVTLVGRVPRPVLELCRRLADAGYRGWVVGGAVRDSLMAAEGPTATVSHHDWDIATDARPEALRRIFKRVIPTGIQHGTVTVLLGGEGFEVTTLRGEDTYSDGRHPDRVQFVDDIEQDLARRDFTINAIAYDPLDDVLIDPFGGAADLSRRCLRAVGNPDERFAEDGLRVLRAARFVATLDLELEASTEAAIRPSLSSYGKVSQERIRDEWCKALLARCPSRAFRVMQQHGLMQVTAPELEALVGCIQNRYHAYDVWEHTLRCLDASSPQLELRLAALLHDLGKPVSRVFSEEKQDYTFHGHESVGASLAHALLTRLRFPGSVRDEVTALVQHHLVVYRPEWSDAAVRRWLRRVTPQLADRVLDLSTADVQAKGRDVSEELQRIAELRERAHQAVQSGAAMGVGDLAVSGRDLIDALQISPGPSVGVLLRQLLDAVTEEPDLNCRQRLLERAAQMNATERSTPE